MSDHVKTLREFSHREEYEHSVIGDAIRAVLEEREQLRAERDYHKDFGQSAKAWMGRAQSAEAHIDEALVLHVDVGDGFCGTCESTDPVPWPCPTAKALRGKP